MDFAVEIFDMEIGDGLCDPQDILGNGAVTSYDLSVWGVYATKSGQMESGNNLSNLLETVTSRGMAS